MIGLYSAAGGLYPTTLRNTGLGWGIGIDVWALFLGLQRSGSFNWNRLEQADYFLLLALPLVFAMLSTYALHEIAENQNVDGASCLILVIFLCGFYKIFFILN